jgi:heme O synthase-like polyprenyltransferase
LKEFWFMNQNLYYNLLYLPFTFLSISYVLDGLFIGYRFVLLADAMLLVAYFVGHGIASHFINEAYSMHFTDQHEARKIKVIGYSSLGLSALFGAIALYVLKWNPYLVAVGLLEIFFLITYNHPKTSYMHNDAVVGVSVGALPALAGYIAAAGYISVESLFLASICMLIVLLEITPSRFVKHWRRKASDPDMVIFKDGTKEPITLKSLIERPERTIKIMVVLSYLLPVFLFFLKNPWALT